MGHLTNVANSIVHSVEKGKNKAALDAIFAGEYEIHICSSGSRLNE